jgi:surfactin synthase thioesterase subunit
MSARDWYVPMSRVTDGQPVQVFAFPHAGAGCAQFAGLAKAAGPAIAVWAANLPGRQARLDEPPPDDLGELAEHLAIELSSQVTGPYGLLGYCGGSLLAFLVARRLREFGVPPPRALIVASFPAPDLALPAERLSRLPSHLLWDRLTRNGGISGDLATDERMRRVAEPAVRADLALLEDYAHTAAPPLTCPIAVCYGSRDRLPRGALLGWRRQSTSPVELRSLACGHWLLDDAVAELAAVVTGVLRAHGQGEAA